MQKRLLSILALFSIMAGTFILFVNGDHVDAATQPQVVAESVRQQILASTLQVTMYEHATDGAQNEAGNRGLASLVTVGGQRFILTHDHWSPMTANLKEVELRDATGALQMVLDAPSFTQLIHYRDGGTMLLKAPAGLYGVLSAEISMDAAASPAQVVWLARRSPADNGATVEVIPARVEAVAAQGMPPRLDLRGLDGHVILPGDSGGGVWLGTQLIGNIWAAGLRSKQSLWTYPTEAGNERATDLIIAALEPFTQGNSTEMMTMKRQLVGQDELGPQR